VALDKSIGEDVTAPKDFPIGCGVMMARRKGCCAWSLYRELELTTAGTSIDLVSVGCRKSYWLKCTSAVWNGQVCSEYFQEMQSHAEYLDLCTAAAEYVGFVFVRAEMQECAGCSSTCRNTKLI
jgi:hypothetical protein